MVDRETLKEALRELLAEEQAPPTRTTAELVAERIGRANQHNDPMRPKDALTGAPPVPNTAQARHVAQRTAREEGGT